MYKYNMKIGYFIFLQIYYETYELEAVNYFYQ